MSITITKSDEGLECFRGLGVSIWHDSFTRRNRDSVLGILHEEQVLTWKLLRQRIVEVAKVGKADIDFLDVGTGSGIFAILVAKELQRLRTESNILAIDKVDRGIDLAWGNMMINEVSFNLRLQKYSLESAPVKSINAIFMNPPYHLFPPSLKKWIPLYAQGGPLGFEKFVNWLKIANEHLSERGSIFFHHMCLGKEQPEFLRFIPLCVSNNPSVHYFEIFPPTDTFSFLRSIYGANPFVHETANRFPKLFFTSGEILKDGLGRKQRDEVATELLAERSWRERISLHKSIANITMIATVDANDHG